MQVTSGFAAITVMVIGIAGTGSAALASTEEAWQEFREQTRTACLALLPEGAEAEIAVDPFGSESYGMALVQTGTGAGAEVMVCVMDKQSGAAQLSGGFVPSMGFAPVAAE